MISIRRTEDRVGLVLQRHHQVVLGVFGSHVLVKLTANKHVVTLSASISVWLTATSLTH